MTPAGTSAIVCTRDRVASLVRALEALGALDLAGVPGFELVVVDNGSSDATGKAVADFAVRAPFPVRLVREPRPGLSRARNAGIAHAWGDTLVFTDDDCYPARDWARVAAGLLAADPMRVIGGRVELHDPDDLRVSEKSSPERQVMRDLSGLFGVVLGANLACGRGVVDRIGGFDVRLGAGTRARAAEDVEFAYRAHRHGIPVAYEPSLLVRHHHARRGEATRRALTRGYATGAGALLAQDLLAGRTALLRPAYWTARAAIRDGDGAAQLAVLGGALDYAARASWRSPR